MLAVSPELTALKSAVMAGRPALVSSEFLDAVHISSSLRQIDASPSIKLYYFINEVIEACYKKITMNPNVRLLVGWSVGRLGCHNFLKQQGRYKTCLIEYQLYVQKAVHKMFQFESLSITSLENSCEWFVKRRRPARIKPRLVT